MSLKRKSAANKIGVLDFETDPFLIGRIPKPFACCVLFTKDDYVTLWDSDSKTDFLSRVIRMLRRLPECTLYAHNGGKFDFHFLLEFADPQILEVRNSRVVKMKIGNVLLKDSFPLMPFPLEEFRKTPIDYAIFEKHLRDKPNNRAKIESYLFDDCDYLLQLIEGFRAVVGDRDTIGAAAFLQMRELGIKIQSLSEPHDAQFRPFYFGGRVEAIQKGIFKGAFQYLDINSAYPRAMKENHAHGADYAIGSKLPPRKLLPQSFIRCIASSKGALPMRDANGGLSFPIIKEAEFFVTGWELAAGLDTRTVKIHQVIEAWIPQNTINFSTYVDTFFAKRQAAKESGDEVKRLAYKYLLNSGYGKFAQNPRDFKTYALAPYGVMPAELEEWDWETDFGGVSLWSKPAYQGFGFFDVATGASITGCVRAMLWRAIVSSRDVLYVDTDAMICKSSTVPLGEKLGEWKLEGIVKRAAIAGKKLYGVEWDKPQKGNPYKIASKGARLSFADILSLCKGQAVEWANAAPTFTIGNPHFIRRIIRAT